MRKLQNLLKQMKTKHANSKLKKIRTETKPNANRNKLIETKIEREESKTKTEFLKTSMN